MMRSMAPNDRWDFDEVLEVVMNKILANTSHPDNIVFMPFNEPDGGNWYASGDNASADIYKQFLTDWNDAYATIQKVWNQYKSGEKTNVNGVKPTADHALIAGPGDSVWRANRTKALLESSKAANTLPDVIVWLAEELSQPLQPVPQLRTGTWHHAACHQHLRIRRTA